MKRAILHFYSANNLGDDLFVGIITCRYDAIFTLITYQHNDYFSKISNTRLTSGNFNKFLSRTLKFITGRNNPLLRYHAKTNDLMVYAGVSIFIEGNNAGHWVKEADFYNSLRIPYYLLGSNIGPYESDSFLSTIKIILNGAEDVCLRDTASYDLVKDLPNARVASDIAFTLDTSPYDTTSDKLAVFSVINCDDRFSPKITQKYEQEIAKLSRNLAAAGYRVVLMSFCKYEGDEDAIRRIITNGGEGFKEIVSTHYYNGDLEKSLALLAKSEIIVASRFHGAILGLLFGKKVLPMAYSSKTTNILKDMSFRGPIIDINNIYEFDGSSFNFSTLEVNNVSDQVKLAEKQFQELDKVLEKRKK